MHLIHREHINIVTIMRLKLVIFLLKQEILQVQIFFLCNHSYAAKEAGNLCLKKRRIQLSTENLTLLVSETVTIHLKQPRIKEMGNIRTKEGVCKHYIKWLKKKILNSSFICIF